MIAITSSLCISTHSEEAPTITNLVRNCNHDVGDTLSLKVRYLLFYRCVGFYRISNILTKSKGK